MNDEQNVTIPLPASEPKAKPETGVVAALPEKPPEFGGPKGLEPTRYGDWEQKGRCTDF